MPFAAAAEDSLSVSWPDLGGHWKPQRGSADGWLEML